MFKALLGVLLLSIVAANEFITGTNIGGWMVLEPWVTPSLFYRFLGKKKSEGVGLGQYTFCEALGPEEGNKVLRAHWDTWYTKDHIKQLADRGVQMVRLPIGDFTTTQYGPFVGCTDGAAEKIMEMYDWCAEYNVTILLDVHTMRGSQNGFDNSGHAMDVIWDGEYNFTHWDTQTAKWISQYNRTTGEVGNINYLNIRWGLKVARELLIKYGSHSAFGGFQPVNEPWWFTPIPVLKDFYREVRKMVKIYAPQAHFVFHDSFRYSPDIWNDLFQDDDYDKVAMDHHYYQAFNAPDNKTVDDLCNDYKGEAGLASQFKMEVWFGEWALATDNCAHWLNGFNDINTIPYHGCQYVDCPYSYLPDEFAVDFDRSASYIGPYGGRKEVQYMCINEGKCQSDGDYYSDEEVKKLGQCTNQAFTKHLNGSFMWTGRNEIEPRWDYIKSWDNGWINKTALPPKELGVKQSEERSGALELDLIQ